MTTASEARRAARAVVDRAHSADVINLLSAAEARLQSGDRAGRDAALESLAWVPSLSAAETMVFERIGGVAMTTGGAADLRERLAASHPDTKSWAAAIQAHRALVAQAVTSAKIVLGALGAGDGEPDDTLGFRFARDASLRTLEDLEHASADLRRLVLTSYRLSGLTPRPARLESVDHGSVIINLTIDAEALDGFAKLAELALTYAGVRATYKALRENAQGQRLQAAATALDKVEDQDLRERMEAELDRAFLGLELGSAEEKHETRNLASAVAKWFGSFLAEGGRMVHRALETPTARLQRAINHAVETGHVDLPQPAAPERLTEGESEELT